MEKPYKKELLLAINLAKRAGLHLMKNYGNIREINFKEAGDFVTNVDIESEKIILSGLKKAFSYSILSEESGSSKKKSDYTWIVDPLDGTTNYTMQNPFFNVAIGLAHKDEIVLGVVYYPITKEVFYAVINQGAYVNGKKIKVRDIKDMSKGILGYCHGSKKPNHIKLTTKIYSIVKSKVNHLRQFGSAALELSYVANGRINGFYMNNMNAYDVCAGSLIVLEAGGIVTDFKGRPFCLKSKHILAAPKNVHKELLKILKKV